MQDEFKLHPLSIYRANIRIMVSKKTEVPRLINKLDSAIDALQKMAR